MSIQDIGHGSETPIMTREEMQHLLNLSIRVSLTKEANRNVSQNEASAEAHVIDQFA